ncbi:sugar porter family MFS transporter [Flammeovirga sp. SubArs3]|uniref:sugar porter family MFS transporter n=1 Tax=Flammeovirga sp. SubArs3 TaxID=2995316 RepID=UPI00248C7213|nr:sugar porter family MFS transporter [Flammeovirga sp. SubArs3]
MKNKNIMYPIMVASIVAIGGFLLGFDGVVNSGAIPFYKHTFDIAETPLLIGISSSMIILGGFLGNLMAGFISDKYGRKKSLLLTSLLFSVGALGTALATDIYFFILCKFIAGLGVGVAILVAPMYISEIAPPKQRGWLVTFNQLNIVLGLSIAYFSNYYILQMIEDPDLNWRWMLGVGAIPALVYMLLLLIIPESPRWLIQQSSHDEAKAVLSKIGGEDYAQKEFEQIKAALDKSGKKQLDSKALRKELFSKKLRLVMMIGVGLAVFQQVSGINAILYYAPMIFEMTGEGQDAAFMQSIIIGLVFVVMTVLSMFLIDRLGRRPLLIIGSTIMSFSLFMTSYYFSEATYSLDARNIDNIKSGLSHQIVMEKAKVEDPSFEGFDHYQWIEGELVLTKDGKTVKKLSTNIDQTLGELTQVEILTAAMNTLKGQEFSSEIAFFDEIKANMKTLFFNETINEMSNSASSPFFSQARKDILKGKDYKEAFNSAINKVFSRDYQSPILNASIHINALWVLLGILGFISGFSISVGPVMWAMLPEILPNKLRGIGISIIGGVNSATSFLVATMFPLELELLGASTTFMIFGFGMIACLLFSSLIVKETKGKSLEEIEKELIGEQISSSSDEVEGITPMAH